VNWLDLQIELFKALQGKTVRRWVGIEMALRDTDDCIPEYQHPTVNYLQMSRLDAELKDGQTARFVTSQDNDIFGLIRFDRLADIPADEHEDRSGFYCPREVSELPIGKIDEVSVVGLTQVISEVHFQIKGKRVSMYAGEVYEDRELNYEVRFLDECVLLQVDGARPEAMSFSPD
jgi:hypothetical protein